jgi:hypothetical protein
VHRIGQLVIAQNDYTTYDARLDLRACLEHIREHYSKAKIYTVAHCMGSVAFSCGLLDGKIPADWILGVTASQVFMNPIWTIVNRAKIWLPPIPIDSLYNRAGGSWFNCRTSKDDNLLQQLLNQLLRFYPTERKELCNNASCHRISFIYGRCWNHGNLNEATHRQIDRFFGGANMSLMHLLMKMGYNGYVMTNGPLFQNLTTDDNVARLRGIQFLLFSGRDNAVLSPESTEKTYEILCEKFVSNSGGPTEGINYKRRLIPGYGHLDCWIGRNAWRDVYPMVREEVDRVTRGEAYRFVEPQDRFKEMRENGML